MMQRGLQQRFYSIINEKRDMMEISHCNNLMKKICCFGRHAWGNSKEISATIKQVCKQMTDCKKIPETICLQKCHRKRMALLVNERNKIWRTIKCRKATTSLNQLHICNLPSIKSAWLVPHFMFLVLFVLQLWFSQVFLFCTCPAWDSNSKLLSVRYERTSSTKKFLHLISISKKNVI